LQYTPSSAKFTLGVIKRKLKSMAENTTATINSTAAKVTKRKPAPKKKIAKGVDEDEDEVDVNPKARAKKIKKNEVESEEVDTMIGVVVKEEVREDEEEF
jgi:hypothetical protein